LEIIIVLLVFLTCNQCTNSCFQFWTNVHTHVLCERMVHKYLPMMYTL